MRPNISMCSPVLLINMCVVGVNTLWSVSQMNYSTSVSLFPFRHHDYSVLGCWNVCYWHVLAVHRTRQLTTCLLPTACLICIVHCPRLPIIKISPVAPLICRLYTRMPGRLEGVSTRIVEVFYRVIHLKPYSNRNVFYWSLLLNTKHMNVHCIMKDIYSILEYKSQKDAHVTEFILSDNCSTCFGRHYHPSSGAQNNCNYSI